MSYLPDRYTGEPPKTAWDILPASANAVQDAQQLYRQCISAVVDVLKRNRFTAIGQDDLGRALENLEDTIRDSVRVELLELEDHGYDETICGDDYRQFIEREFLVLNGLEREKTIPHVRLITNPQTFADRGEGL